MGGIGLSSTEPQPNTTHTCTHTHTHKIHTYAIIHLNREQHTERTQYAHNIRTQNTLRNRTSTHNIRTENNTQNNTQNTAHNLSTEQHTCTHFIHIHSFDFIAYDNISKNSIIQLYTNYIQTIYILLALFMR